MKIEKKSDDVANNLPAYDAFSVSIHPSAFSSHAPPGYPQHDTSHYPPLQSYHPHSQQPYQYQYTLPGPMTSSSYSSPTHNLNLSSSPSPSTNQNLGSLSTMLSSKSDLIDPTHYHLGGSHLKGNNLTKKSRSSLSSSTTPYPGLMSPPSSTAIHSIASATVSNPKGTTSISGQNLAMGSGLTALTTGATSPPSSKKKGSGGGGGPKKNQGQAQNPSEYPKPTHSYSLLITKAISESPMKQLTLNDIYEWTMNNHPWYRTATNGWKVIIRHLLSLLSTPKHETFISPPHTFPVLHIFVLSKHTPITCLILVRREPGAFASFFSLSSRTLRQEDVCFLGLDHHFFFFSCVHGVYTFLRVYVPNIHHSRLHQLGQMNHRGSNILFILLPYFAFFFPAWFIAHGREFPWLCANKEKLDRNESTRYPSITTTTCHGNRWEEELGKEPSKKKEDESISGTFFSNSKHPVLPHHPFVSHYVDTASAIPITL